MNNRLPPLPKEFRVGHHTQVWTRQDGLVAIDTPIAPLVAALNQVHNVQTLFSCCGHGSQAAYVLFSALDGNVDALMCSEFIEALRFEFIFLKREIILSALPLAEGEIPNPADYDRFVLEFSMGTENIERWYRQRDALVELCQEYREKDGENK